jgi:hypothetical protein
LEVVKIQYLLQLAVAKGKKIPFSLSETATLQAMINDGHYDDAMKLMRKLEALLPR